MAVPPWGTLMGTKASLLVSARVQQRKALNSLASTSITHTHTLHTSIQSHSHTHTLSHTHKHTHTLREQTMSLRPQWCRITSRVKCLCVYVSLCISECMRASMLCVCVCVCVC